MLNKFTNTDNYLNLEITYFNSWNQYNNKFIISLVQYYIENKIYDV